MSWWESDKAGTDGAISNCTCLEVGNATLTAVDGSSVPGPRHCTRWNCIKVCAPNACSPQGILQHAHAGSPKGIRALRVPKGATQGGVGWG